MQEIELVNMQKAAKKTKMSYNEMAELYNLPARFSLVQYSELI